MSAAEYFKIHNLILDLNKSKDTIKKLNAIVGKLRITICAEREINADRISKIEKRRDFYKTKFIQSIKENKQLRERLTALEDKINFPYS